MFNIGIIGCGKIAQVRHIPEYLDRPEAKLAGLFDLNKDRAKELGEQLGRSSCAMLAVTDFGFAAALAEKLAARDEERYGPAAQQLRAKADRALMRQREKRQHEKNMRQGKHKPWAAPPSRPSKREEAPPTTSRRERGKGGSGRRPGRPETGTGRAPRTFPGKPGPGGRKLTAKPRSGGRNPAGKP